MYRKTVQQLSSESTSACLYDEHTPSSSYRLRYNNFFFGMEVKEGPNHHAYIYAVQCVRRLKPIIDRKYISNV